MTYNFYQSKVWLDIISKVYGRPMFEVEIFGEKYFGVEKTQKKLGVELKWYQILGVEVPQRYLENKMLFVEELEILKRDFSKKFGDMFFQIGFINEIDVFDVVSLKDDEFVKNVVNKRKDLEKEFINDLGIYPSIRENMPMATVMIDLDLSAEDLFVNMSKSCKTRYKKGVKNNLEFAVADEKQWDEFYDLWNDVSSGKGFHVIDKSTFQDLKRYVLDGKKGDLLVALKDGKVVVGSLCLYDGDEIIYLYGAASRQIGNIGGHQFLKYEIIKWAKEKGYKQFELFGTSPTGIDHHLDGVSRLKQSLGGKKYEYYGNFDLVFNKSLYETFKLIKNMKKH